MLAGVGDVTSNDPAQRLEPRTCIPLTYLIFWGVLDITLVKDCYSLELTKNHKRLIVLG